MSINVVKISKTFNQYQVLDDVSMSVKEGEFLALLGPSGSGKTTLLRIIAGLEEADEGEVFLEGKQASGLPIAQRNIGFVFQHYALFRHMTVFDNIAFGLSLRAKKQGLSKEQIRSRVMDLLRLVHLEGMQYQYPSELSGGQRQRVALARVLAITPKVMLLDEPFGALDAKVRKDLRGWLRRLHNEMEITTIFVTHDQEEAMEIADRVAVMNYGKIEQIGTPDEVWNRPVNAFVYDFLGHYNDLLAWRDDVGGLHLCKEQSQPDKQHNGVPRLKRAKAKGIKERLALLFQKLTGRAGLAKKEPVESLSSLPKQPQQSHYDCRLFVRPFELDLLSEKSPDKPSLPVRVVHINPAGALIKVEVDYRGKLFQAEVSKETLERLKIKKSDDLWICPKRYTIFDL